MLITLLMLALLLLGMTAYLMVEAWKHNRHLRLEAHADFPGRAPACDRLTDPHDHPGHVLLLLVAARSKKRPGTVTSPGQGCAT
ncbi:MAG: hypothetical protein R6V75_06195 [Bacteroidales bacterium]